jgi:hypothetical protein
MRPSRLLVLFCFYRYILRFRLACPRCGVHTQTQLGKRILYTCGDADLLGFRGSIRGLNQVRGDDVYKFPWLEDTEKSAQIKPNRN